MKPRRRQVLAVLGEAVPVVVVAYLVFLLIRTNLLEYYRIPSKSMEPTLHGDPERGDLVLVNKAAYLFGGQPEPFDLVVVRHQTSVVGSGGRGSHMVKRMVALGPAFVSIQEGDLFVGSLQGGDRKRIVKDPLAHRDLRVPVFVYPGSRGDEFTDIFRIPPGLGGVREDHVELRAAQGDLLGLADHLDPEKRRRQRQTGDLDLHLPGHLSTHQAVAAAFLDADGRRRWTDRRWQSAWRPDIGLALEMVFQGKPAGLQLVLEHEDHTVAIAYGADGRGRVLVDGATSGEDFRGPALVPGAATRLAFGYLDGRLFVTVGEGTDAEQLVLHRELEVPGEGRGYRRENALHLALAGTGAKLEIRALTVFRDLVYTEDDRRTQRLGVNQPYLVPHGHMFLLGDNTWDSEDSRDFEFDQPSVDDLVGRPLMILAPLSRSRVLPR